MESLAFVVVAAGILGFGLISEKVQKSILTPPMAFVAFGLAVSHLGMVHFHVDEHMIHTLAEITLVLVLFTDASRIDLRLLRQEHDLPVRLLLIGMPLTVILGTLSASWLFPAFTIWEAALLAAVLAPTDAALGQAVVSSPLVPVRIRQALNVESGLNDGIALPLVLVFLSTCASAVPGQGGTEYWLKFAALQVTLGPLVGFLVGGLGGRWVQTASERGWMSHPFVRLSSLGLALLSFAAAEVIGGNGFIAAFCAGLAMGNAARRLSDAIHNFAEAEGQLLTLLVFLIFGASILPELLHHGSGAMWIYAVLSLTVVRMLPVALSLLGMGLRWQTVGFLGWFGPRGIASILFGLLVVESSVLEARDEIFQVVIATVVLSVLAHGVTAYPGAKWYARCSGTLDSEEAPEHQQVTEMPVRTRHA